MNGELATVCMEAAVA